MSRGPLVDRAPAVASVLRHVRGDVHPAQFSYEFSRVVVLVPSQGHPLSRRDGFGHEQRSISLRSAIRFAQKGLQQKPVAGELLFRARLLEIAVPGELLFRRLQGV
jgi:hypothetical protein